MTVKELREALEVVPDDAEVKLSLSDVTLDVIDADVDDKGIFRLYI